MPVYTTLMVCCRGSRAGSEYTPSSPVRMTSSPVSSRISRTAACSQVSPSSINPPGKPPVRRIQPLNKHDTVFPIRTAGNENNDIHGRCGVTVTDYILAAMRTRLAGLHDQAPSMQVKCCTIFGSTAQPSQTNRQKQHSPSRNILEGLLRVVCKIRKMLSIKQPPCQNFNTEKNTFLHNKTSELQQHNPAHISNNQKQDRTIF